MKTCFIIDNDDRAIELLSSYIEKTPDIKLAGRCGDPVKALLIIEAIRPDIIFTIIDLPEISGIELCGLIRHPCSVIFTSIHERYALAAFNNNACDFLLKPVSYSRFLQAIMKVKSYMFYCGKRLPANFFFIKTELKGKLIRVDADAIIFIESLNNYIEIHLNDQKHITYLTLKETEESLPSAEFKRVHKSFIINVKKIRMIEGNQIWLENGKCIMIGESYRKGFHDSLGMRTLQSSRR